MDTYICIYIEIYNQHMLCAFFVFKTLGAERRKCQQLMGSCPFKAQVLLPISYTLSYQCSMRFYLVGLPLQLCSCFIPVLQIKLCKVRVFQTLVACEAEPHWGEHGVVVLHWQPNGVQELFEGRVWESLCNTILKGLQQFATLVRVHCALAAGCPMPLIKP